MADFEEVLLLLDQQCGDYQSMYRLSLEQRACIEREDMAALEASFARMHHLMDRIRLRQERIPDLDRSDPEIARRCSRMRQLLVDLQEMTQFNQRAAEQRLERTREEIRRFGLGRRAVRGYRRAGVEGARLFDGVR